MKSEIVTYLWYLKRTTIKFLNRLDIPFNFDEKYLVLDNYKIDNYLDKYENLPKPWVCFAIDSTEVNRIWPQEYFAQIADKLISRNLAKTIFSSAGVEYPLKPGTKNGELNSDWSWELIITERYQPNTTQLISKTDLRLLDLKTLVFIANTIYEFKTVRISRKQAFKWNGTAIKVLLS